MWIAAFFAVAVGAAQVASAASPCCNAGARSGPPCEQLAPTSCCKAVVDLSGPTGPLSPPQLAVLREPFVHTSLCLRRAFTKGALLGPRAEERALATVVLRL